MSRQSLGEKRMIFVCTFCCIFMGCFLATETDAFGMPSFNILFLASKSNLPVRIGTGASSTTMTGSVPATVTHYTKESMKSVLLLAARNDQVDAYEKDRDMYEDETSSTSTSSVLSGRRDILSTAAAAAVTFVLPLQTVNAAPPMAIIAEELGYFPVTNKQGETVNVPKRITRPSSEQAVDLALHLKKVGAVMYGAYWCPHCARQRELFGKEAWNSVPYVECATKGFNANPKLCIDQQVDGYPTWIFPKNPKSKRVLGGEASLEVLAQMSKFSGTFRPDLEQNVPPLLGSNSCK